VNDIVHDHEMDEVEIYLILKKTRFENVFFLFIKKFQFRLVQIRILTLPDIIIDEMRILISTIVEFGIGLNSNFAYNTRCSLILQSLLVVVHFLVSYYIVYPIVGSEKKPIGFRQLKSHRIPSVEIRPDSVVRSDRI